MATETQYKVFKEIYDDEAKRYSDLGTRCNLYLTIITFYVGVILLKVSDVVKAVTGFGVSAVWFLCVGILLLSALLLTVAAASIREYEGICDPEEIIEKFGKTSPADEGFLDDRIVDLAVATNRNSTQNNRVARLLQWAVRAIFLAVLLQVLVFTIGIVHARSSNHANTCEAEKIQIFESRQ
jgi:hypothetical protein